MTALDSIVNDEMTFDEDQKTTYRDILKKHYQDLTSIDEHTLNHIMNVAKTLKLKLEEKLCCDGLTLVQNNGDVQEVKHFHLHLKPYYKEKRDKDIKEVYDLLK